MTQALALDPHPRSTRHLVRDPRARPRPLHSPPPPRRKPGASLLAFVATFALLLASTRTASANMPSRVAVAAQSDGTLVTFYVEPNGALSYKMQVHPTAMTGTPRNETYTLNSGLVSSESPIATNWPGPNWETAVQVYANAGAVALGTNANACLEAFFTDASTNVLYHTWQSPPPNGAPCAPGTPFVSPGLLYASSTTATNIVVAPGLGGALTVFYVSPADGYVHTVWQYAPSSGPWMGATPITTSAKAGVFTPPSGPSYSEITVEKYPDGQLDFFFIGPSNNLWEVVQTSAQTGWNAAAKLAVAGTVSHVSASRDQDGILALLTADTSNNLNHLWQTALDTDTWSGASIAASPVYGITTAINNPPSDGRIEALLINSNGNLEHIAQIGTSGTGVWGSETQFGWGTESMAAATDAAGCLEVFYTRQTVGPINPGTGQPYTDDPHTGEPYDGALYHQYQLTPGYWWSGEYPLPDASATPPFTVGAFSLILPHLNATDPSGHGGNNDHTLIQTNDAWYLYGIITAGSEFPAANWMGEATGPIESTFANTTCSDTDPSACPLEYPTPTLPASMVSTCGGTPSCGVTCPASFCESLGNGHELWAPYVLAEPPGCAFGACTYYMFYADGSETNDETSWWEAVRTSTDLVNWGNTESCGTYGSSSLCDAQARCTWSSATSTCIGMSCSRFTSSATCTPVTGCTWSSNACTGNVSPCSAATSATTCGTQARCMWSAASNVCMGTDPVELFADGIQARDPMVLALNGATCPPFRCVDGETCGGGGIPGVCGQYVMYYPATDSDSLSGGHHDVAYRTSNDLVHWSSTRAGNAYTDHHWGSDYGPTESPYVLQHGADLAGNPYYYLFIGPRPYDDPLVNGNDGQITPNQPDVPTNLTEPQAPGYVGTDVYRSINPFEWDNSDYVGSIPAHALEVVQDPANGIWYVTSAGGGQDGVYAAEITWND